MHKGALLIAFVPLLPLLLTASPLDELMPRPKSVKAAPSSWRYCADQVKRSGETPSFPSPEGYRLEVRPEGAFWSGHEGYARTTLRQLARLGGGRVPCCTIVDWPTLGIRGMMHDTGRNWQPLSQLKRQLVRMAEYKLNFFHWHLTDNHGWRLESRRYPALSAPENLDRTDSFYTRSEFRELLSFARKLGITVMPELDVPGHTRAFRRAFGIGRMDDPRVREIVAGLFRELADLLDPSQTPYIHIGSDEVKGIERVPDSWLSEWISLLQKRGFRVVGWGPGLTPGGSHTPLVRQYWRGRQVRRDPETFYIDSQSSYYINHVDPMELLAPAAFQKPCLTGSGRHRLGAIFAVWHDDAVASPGDILSMNPVYPAMVLYGDNFWNGRERDRMDYYANLPDPRTPEFSLAVDLERRALAQKRLFKGEPFALYPQTRMRWRLAEGEACHPFAEFPWGERIIAQATIYPHHFFFSRSNLVGSGSRCVWLGTIVRSDRERETDLIADCMNYSRSDGRNRDLALVRGEWNAKGAEICLNGRPLPPPDWRQPGIGRGSREIPMADEVWSARPPQRVRLRKGANELLIKLPRAGWKWSVTCFFPDPRGLDFEAPSPRRPD